MKQTLQDSGVIRFSSPPRGSLISISNLKNNKTTYWQCSRPLHGVLLSQYREECANGDVGQVLVPSTGFSYLNIMKGDEWHWRHIVLVHSTGFSYLNMTGKVNQKTRHENSSRPLHGVLLSQFCAMLPSSFPVQFSSPPRGSLISILSLTPPKTQGFHPPFAGQTRKWEKPQYQTGV